MVWIEFGGNNMDLSTNLKKVGNQIQILNDDGSMKGHFSKLSNFISVNTKNDFFDGTCKEIK